MRDRLRVLELGEPPDANCGRPCKMRKKSLRRPVLAGVQADHQIEGWAPPPKQGLRPP